MKKIMFVGLLLSSSTFAFKGMDICAYGTRGCNSCVTDVPAAFANIGEGSAQRHLFHVTKIRNRPWRFLQDHVQSMARIPGLGEENWIAMSRSAEKPGDGGIFLVKFQDIQSDGRAWKHAKRESDKAFEYYFHPVMTANHPGGMQALGTMLFVADECLEANCFGEVNVYDVSDPKRPVIVTSWPHRRGSSVAAVKLEDGKYLAYVGGRKSGRMMGHFFLSSGPELTQGTTWAGIGNFNPEERPEIPWGGWESANFVTECGSRDIYYVGMGERKSHTGLYKLKQEAGQLSFEFIADKNVNGTLFNTFRMGAGMHVTSDRKMIMYNTTRFGRRINEFREKN